MLPKAVPSSIYPLCRYVIAPTGFLHTCGWSVLGILLCVLVPPAAAAQPAVKNVLVLHNWANLPQSWALMESTVRARVPGQINFYTASVENPRFDEEAYRESLAETLRRGYSGVKLDLVVAATYPVLQFAMQYRDKMFPGVPIVFTDVGRQEDAEDVAGRHRRDQPCGHAGNDRSRASSSSRYEIRSPSSPA